MHIATLSDLVDPTTESRIPLEKRLDEIATKYCQANCPPDIEFAASIYHGDNKDKQSSSYCISNELFKHNSSLTLNRFQPSLDLPEEDSIHSGHHSLSLKNTLRLLIISCRETLLFIHELSDFLVVLAPAKKLTRVKDQV